MLLHPSAEPLQQAVIASPPRWGRLPGSVAGIASSGTNTLAWGNVAHGPFKPAIPKVHEIHQEGMRWSRWPNEH